MAELLTLEASLRDRVGTGPARELRGNGMIPAVVYGYGFEPLHIAVLEKEITKLYRSGAYTSHVLNIAVNGQVLRVVPKDIQLHYISDIAHHADFMVVKDAGTQEVEVEVVFDGKERSLGVKRGGFFNIIRRKIPLACDVDSIPRCVVVDVSRLRIGQSLYASQLRLPKGTSLARKRDFVIASITGRGGKKDASDEEAS